MTERTLCKTTCSFRRLAALMLALSLLFTAAIAQEEAPQALYRAVAQFSVTIREEPSRDAPSIGYYNTGDRVYITGYEPEWVSVVKGDTEGWILRHSLDEHTTIAESEPPFGTFASEYVAVVGRELFLRDKASEDGKILTVIPEGAHLALADLRDGWGRLLYWRQEAYVRLDNGIASMEPVYAPQDALPGDILGAYCTFYALSGYLVQSRVHNIAQACRYINVVLEPGERFSFNDLAGPYGPGMGYEKALAFYEGGAVPGYGGGACQVSTTMYNALLPLVGRGIDVLYRRAHGPSGATYVPHGVDAAVGTEDLDLVIQNRFDYPIRIEAISNNDGVVYVALIRES